MTVFHPSKKSRTFRARLAGWAMMSLAIGPAALGGSGTVHTKDGQSVYGEIIETPRSVVVRTKDGVKVIPIEQVTKLDRQNPATMPSVPSLPPATTEASTTAPDNNGLVHLLTADEINNVRQTEMSPLDDKVTFKFEAAVEKAFCVAEGMQLGAFKALSPLARFMAIRKAGTPMMLNRVRVLRDPKSVATYRQIIQAPLLVGCATAGCHGGPLAGDFVLANPALDDNSVYTNFYALSTYVSRKDGAIIDRVSPNSSLLLQYGLPQSISDRPHPKVPGFKPVFKDTQDVKFARSLDWITHTLDPLVTRYGFERAAAGKAAPSTVSGGSVPANTHPATPSATTGPSGPR